MRFFFQFPTQGMVSQEEYEYSAFKCAFCKALNPAKKIRPIAPRLILPEKITGETSNKPQPSKTQQSSSSAPVTDKDSGNNVFFFDDINDFF